MQLVMTMDVRRLRAAIQQQWRLTCHCTQVSVSSALARV